MTRQLPADPPRDDIPEQERRDLVPVEDQSPKSRKVAFTLACFGGFLGLHRFYTGRIWSGLAMLLTAGGFLIWWVIDFFVLLSGRFKDGDGRVLGRPMAVRRDEVDHLPDEVRDKLPAERLDTDPLEEDPLEDDELLEDPLEKEFEQLEENVDADRGTDGRV